MGIPATAPVAVPLKHRIVHLPPLPITVVIFFQIPAIMDGDFAVRDSAAILRYLSRTRSVPDQWYPKVRTRAVAELLRIAMH